jgi:PASTA domain
MDSLLDWILENVVEVLADLFTDRTSRERRHRRIAPRWTTVPELRNLPVPEARDALARAGLRMTLVRVTASADSATGTVISQDPPPWRAARRRHRVTVRI